MRNTVSYEWCIEKYTDDEYEDIVDNYFSEKLVFGKDDLLTEEGYKTRLVLIRDTGNNDEGLQDRIWAYVKDNKLPEYFTDSLGEQTKIKVPMKFHKELSLYTII